MLLEKPKIRSRIERITLQYQPPNEAFIETSDLAIITVGKEPGLMLNVTIKRNKKRDYLAKIQFSDDGVEKDISQIISSKDGATRLFYLVEEYQYKIKKLLEDKLQQQRTNIVSKRNWKGIIRRVRINQGIRFLKERLNILEDLQSINICTFDSKNKEQVIAITKIELDADIITVVSNDINDDDDNITKRKILLAIHSCNVYYANQLFAQQVKTLKHNLIFLRNLMRASSPMPVGMSLFYASSDIINSISMFYTYPGMLISIPATVTSAIFYRYNMQIIFRLTPRIVSILFKTISARSFCNNFKFHFKTLE